MSMYNEIVKVVGLEFVRGEDVQAYLRSVLESINDLDDTKWNELGAEAQEWFNEMARKVETDENNEIDLLDGMTALIEEVVAPEQSASAPTEEEAPKAVSRKPRKTSVAHAASAGSGQPEAETAEAPKRRGRKPAVKVEGEATEVVKKERKPRQPKAEKPAAPRKVRTVARSDAKSAIIRAALCRNMDVTVEELLEELANAGHASQRAWVQTYRLVSVRMLEQAVAAGEVKNAAGEVVLRKV